MVARVMIVLCNTAWSTYQFLKLKNKNKGKVPPKVLKILKINFRLPILLCTGRIY